MVRRDSSGLRLLGGACAAALVGGSLAGWLAGHGSYVKTLFNVVETTSAFSTQQNPRWDPATSKANATTRGSTSQATTLYAMDPQRNHTGRLQVEGFRAVVTDEEAITLENQFTASFVKYAAGAGGAPDTSAAGLLHRYSFWFFFGATVGRQTFEFEVTFGVPVVLSEPHHGLGVTLPAAPAWPRDGLSVSAQLNLPNHPLRPRVPAAFAQQVFAWEMPQASSAPVPLGGRTLDTLQMGTLFSGDAVLKAFVRSSAYGAGIEDLYGPESLHPDAARGDALGFFLQSATAGSPSVAFLFVSPALLTTPFPLTVASGHRDLWLSAGGLFPFLLATGVPSVVTGQLRFAPIPFAAFPPGFRDVWFQAVVSVPQANVLYLTDAVGVQGL